MGKKIHHIQLQENSHASQKIIQVNPPLSVNISIGTKWSVLRALDVAKIQWYHFKAIVISGMGFFTDAYDLFCISLVTNLLGRIYYPKEGDPTKPGTLPLAIQDAVTVVSLCGAVLGQLFFGVLADKIGRKKVYGITLILMVVSPIASGLSLGKHAGGVMANLCFWRFWLGFGIGGDYPISATIMSEFANKTTRGAFVAAVFAMQGFGILFAGIVSMIVSAAFKDDYYKTSIKNPSMAIGVPDRADYVWRIILMFGSLPAAVTYYWRMKMPETARYTALVAKNAKQAAQDMAKMLKVELDAEEEEIDRMQDERKDNFGLFSKEFLHRHGLHLLGTSSAWFFLDMAFYSQTLCQRDIFYRTKLVPSIEQLDAIHEVYLIARAQTFIALWSTVPGYWFTVAFIDRIGRVAVQLMGFFFMTVFMFTLAIAYKHWNTSEHRVGFVVLYSLTFFFSNFGPNVTTFVVPAEIFPARMRSTCHGISGAAGKAGATVGALAFLHLTLSSEGDPYNIDPQYQHGIRKALILLSAINFGGLLCTLLVPESKGKSLEELTGEAECEVVETIEQFPDSNAVPV